MKRCSAGLTLVALHLLLSHLANPLHAQSSQLVDVPAMELSLHAGPAIALGEPVIITVSLENISSRSVSLPISESSRLRVIVERAAPAFRREANLDGTVATRRKQRPDGTVLTVHYQMQREFTNLAPGRRLDRNLDLAKDCGMLLSPGEYTMTAEYEGALKATAEFRVVITDDQTVPTLIRLIETGDLQTKIWARNSLFILTGQPQWELTAKDQDNESEMKKRLDGLRSWWSANQSRLKLEGTRFVAK